MRQGVLLFAHGARDPAWALPFEQVRDRLTERYASRDAAHAVHVGLAYLEFMSPNLIDAGQALAARGCLEVTVVPLFLGAGGHVRKDLPVLVAQLQAAHPHLAWRLARAAGETDTVVQALADAASDLAGLTP